MCQVGSSLADKQLGGQYYVCGLLWSPVTYVETISDDSFIFTLCMCSR